MVYEAIEFFLVIPGDETKKLGKFRYKLKSQEGRLVWNIVENVRFGHLENGVLVVNSVLFEGQSEKYCYIHLLFCQ